MGEFNSDDHYIYYCGQETYDKPRQCVEKQRHFSAHKVLYSQGYGCPSGHVGF